MDTDKESVEPVTLRSIRLARGLPSGLVFERMRAYRSAKPWKDGSTLSHIEAKGTDSISTLEAWAAAVGETWEMARKANENTQALRPTRELIRKPRASKNSL